MAITALGAHGAVAYEAPSGVAFRGVTLGTRELVRSVEREAGRFVVEVGNSKPVFAVASRTIRVRELTPVRVGRAMTRRTIRPFDREHHARRRVGLRRRRPNGRLFGVARLA